MRAHAFDWAARGRDSALTGTHTRARGATGESEAAVKAAGKLRTEGRKYEVKDGDIIHFKFNASKK